MQTSWLGMQPPGPFSTSFASAPHPRRDRQASHAPSVLIVEDHLMIADMTEDYLNNHGYEVCGIARTVDEAVALGLRHRPDLVVLDVRLADGGMGTDIAAGLTSLGNLGILYVTGDRAQVALTTRNGHACLDKPFRFTDLVRALRLVADLVETGRAKPPYPSGFRLLHSFAAA
jgi:DNA-binding response OmpR family regulator